MVEEFNNACFSARKGDLVVVNTQFGTHLIEVVDKSKSTRKSRSQKGECSNMLFFSRTKKSSFFSDK